MKHQFLYWCNEHSKNISAYTKKLIKKLNRERFSTGCENSHNSVSSFINVDKCRLFKVFLLIFPLRPGTQKKSKYFFSVEVVSKKEIQV
jgi:hypothetical protein